MRKHDIFKNAVCVFILIMVPVSALGNPLEIFQDRASFQGIKSVTVFPVIFENMETVKLSPEVLQSSIQEKLRRAGITYRTKRSLAPGSITNESNPQDVGILSATVRRSTSPGPLMSMNSFSVSLRLFQTAHIQSSDHQGWVITWLGNRSVVVGTKRPQHIIVVLDELVAAFIQDFRPTGSSH